MKELISIENSVLKKISGKNNYRIKIPKGTQVGGINGLQFLPSDAATIIDDSDFLGKINGRAILKENAKAVLNYKVGEQDESLTVNADVFAKMLNNKWTTFTISKKQVINSWMNSQNIKRAAIIIPGINPEFEGCSVVINYNCLKNVQNNQNIFLVAIPSIYEFKVLKPTILGTDEDGKTVYGDNNVVDTLYGHQLAELFKMPERVQFEMQEHSIGADQALPDQMGNTEILAGPDGKFGTADDIISPDNSAQEIEENMQNGQGIVR